MNSWAYGLVNWTNTGLVNLWFGQMHQGQVVTANRNAVSALVLRAYRHRRRRRPSLSAASSEKKSLTHVFLVAT